QRVRLRRCRSCKAACSPEDHRARQTLTRSYHQCAEVPGKTRAYMLPPGQKIPPAPKVPGADHRGMTNTNQWEIHGSVQPRMDASGDPEPGAAEPVAPAPGDPEPGDPELVAPEPAPALAPAPRPARHGPLSGGHPPADATKERANHTREDPGERAAQADPARPPVPQEPDLPTGCTTPDRTETAVGLDEATVVNMHLVYVQGLRRNVLPRSELPDNAVHLGDMQECDGRPMRAEDSCIHPSFAAPTVLPGTSAGTRRPAQPSPMTTGHSGRDPPTVAATHVNSRIRGVWEQHPPYDLHDIAAGVLHESLLRGILTHTLTDPRSC
ncbi:hypothetical protein PIB30_100208, partial [Stylosanthes scabra]|nr:hypothetical protein [Stylosanthes scabra]